MRQGKRPTGVSGVVGELDGSRWARDRERRGWGPFTGRQLTVVIVAIAAMFAIPTAALAASGAFTSSSNTVSAVTGTNTGGSGVGVKGTGKRFGVYSNGNLGVAAGKSLSCTACAGPAALTTSAKSGRLLYQNSYSFVGPYGPNLATFVVPSGLMCVRAAASAVPSGTPPVLLDVVFQPSNGAPGPLVEAYLSTDEASVHKALVDTGTVCETVPAETVTYEGTGGTDTGSDVNDTGSLSVEVFSQ